MDPILAILMRQFTFFLRTKKYTLVTCDNAHQLLLYYVWFFFQTLEIEMALQIPQELDECYKLPQQADLIRQVWFVIWLLTAQGQYFFHAYG